jgi:hypothetical protein
LNDASLGATDQGAEVIAADHGAQVGATDQGAELGATDKGAEPGATSAAISCHAGSAASHLGAKIHGAASHGAELRVHLPNSFQQGSNCELLSQKGPKSKKVGRLLLGPSPTLIVVFVSTSPLTLTLHYFFKESVALIHLEGRKGQYLGWRGSSQCRRVLANPRPFVGWCAGNGYLL